MTDFLESAIGGALAGSRVGGPLGAVGGFLAGPVVDALVEKATGKDLKGHSGTAFDLAIAALKQTGLANPGQVAGTAIDTAQQAATTASGIAAQAQATAAQALATQEQARAAAKQAFDTGQFGLFVSMKTAADKVGLLAVQARSIAIQAQATAKTA